MTRYQLLLLPTIAAAIMVLGGALSQKKQPLQPPAAIDATSVSDPEALAILDQAAAALAPARVPWLETKVWQQVRCDDFVYQAAGRMLTGPGQQMRFDLNVQVGGTLGEVRMVSDGIKLWQSLRAGSENPNVQCWELPKQGEKPISSAELAKAREQWMQQHGCGGFASMLRTMRERMQGAQIIQQRWRGREVWIVSAAWPENTPPATGGPDLTAPRYKLRQCHLFLDTETFWPHRIEWWGAEKPSQPDELLMQTEYRSPILNQPLSAERCADEFSFAGS